MKNPYENKVVSFDEAKKAQEKEQPRERDSTKKHWYLITGELHVRTAIKGEPTESEEIPFEVSPIKINGIYLNKDRIFSAVDMAKIRQVLLAEAEKRGILADYIQDIVILNMVYIGNQSEKDFFKE